MWPHKNKSTSSSRHLLRGSHHTTEGTNLNISLESSTQPSCPNDVASILSFKGALRCNSLFWENLAPWDSSQSESKNRGSLNDQKCFFGLDEAKKQMSAKTIAVQGSGWGWLGYNPSTMRLEIATRANQDPLGPTTGLVPLLGIDVWEHAYYVDYRNGRSDDVNAVWDVINWDVVEGRYIAAKGE